MLGVKALGLPLACIADTVQYNCAAL